MRKISNSKGFTIIELIVAMGLFLVAISIATGGFIRSLRTQKDLTELLSINDNAGLALEQMAREMRTGYNFSKVSESEIQFVNSGNVVVYYRLNNGTLERGETDQFLQITYRKITADSVRITNFKITLMGNLPGDGFPPRITVSISVSGKGRDTQNVSTDIQTTISSRTLDI